MALLASHAQCRDLLISGRPEPCVLLELDEALLGEVLRDGVSIKGPLDGDAVLCTREATFDLKTVETTNSLLLVPEGEPSTSLAVAASAARSHIELIRAAPRWEGLDAALAATSYGDDDHENANDDDDENEETDGENKKSSGVFSAAARRARRSPLLSFSELLQRVQASESELRAELAARGAFSWNRKRNGTRSGKEEEEEGEGEGGRQEKDAKRSKVSSPTPPPPAVRVLEPSFEASMLDYLLLTAAGNGWRPHALPTEDLVRAMVSPPRGGGFGDESTGQEGQEEEQFGGGGGGGGGYDEGVLRHALARWSTRRTEGGRGGMRASDDGGGGGGSGAGGGGGASPGTAPAPFSQGGRSPSSAAAAAAAAPPPLSFDEDLHEASAEAFSSSSSGDDGQRPRDNKRGRRPPLPALLALDSATVQRHEARKLLRDSPAWPEASFTAAWREALERLGVDLAAAAAGAGMQPAGSSSLDLHAATSGGGALAGLATLLPPQQRSQTERTVVRLDASALPRDPRSRFAALFAAKARWRKEEIAPYLLGAAVAPGTPGGTGALLLAHARASQSEPDAPVFFSAR